MPTTTPAQGTGARPQSRPGKAPSPSTLVLLVRHGATPTTGQVLPGRAPGLHLADRGRAQAATVADRLAAWSASARPATNGKAGPATGGRRISAVYASPLERTRETAAPIARALGLKVQTHRGLLECDFGEWTGAELKKLMKLPEWSTVQRYPSGFRFPGGESFTAMQARIVTAIADLCRRHPGETVVAVSHADPIKAAVNDAAGSHLDLFQRVVISPCSVTAISYGPVGPTVLAVNSTATLEELVPS
ncbi:MAG TPA: histidine phosphatase family protein [Acidimicrobiales bacterium]|nr:histidine phosphatase family protein [Acidimicrobiales bacterium]